MHQAEPFTPGHLTPRVLATGTSEAGTVEVVERPDGTVVIQLDGAEIPGYRWGSANVEACINAYLRLLRR